MSGTKKPKIKNEKSARDLILKSVGMVFGRLGFTEAVGKTWVTLFLCAKPMDAKDLREKLGLSTGALSMALKELVGINIVTRESKKSSRRFYYRAESDLWLVITRIFNKHEKRRLQSVLQMLENARQLVRVKKDAKYDKELDFYYDQLERLVRAGEFIIGMFNVLSARTKVELKAARKLLDVSSRLGGESLSRLKRMMGRNFNG